MAQDPTVLALVVVTVAVLPALLLWGFLRLIDRGADEEKIEELRQAGREGQQPDISGVSLGAPVDSERDGPPTESVDTAPTPDASPAASTAEDTVTCPTCGSENDADYDRCWDCLSDL